MHDQIGLRPVGTIGGHKEFLETSRQLERRRRERIRKRIRDIVNQRIEKMLWENEDIKRLIDEYLAGSEESLETPYTLAELVVEKLGLEQAPDSGG